MSRLKEKVDELSRDYRDIQIELRQRDKLVKLYEQKSSEQEDKVKKQIELFKESFSKKLDEARLGESTLVIEK